MFFCSSKYLCLGNNDFHGGKRISRWKKVEWYVKIKFVLWMSDGVGATFFHFKKILKMFYKKHKKNWKKKTKKKSKKKTLKNLKIWQFKKKSKLNLPNVILYFSNDFVGCSAKRQGIIQVRKH